MVELETVQTTRPNILILTSLTGGGHLSLALALQDALGEHYNIEIVDPHPKIFHRYYTFVGRHFLGLWGVGYKVNDNEVAALRLHKILTVLLQKRLCTIIGQINPQLIITTHTLLSYEVARAIELSGKSIPFVFQLSELEEVHSTWLTERNADAYLVPTREILAQARARGIDECRLHLTGMPVRRQFLQDYSASKTETLASLGFDPGVFTVFLQGGAEGAAGIERSVKSMLAAGKSIQIILAVGTNKQLASRFRGIDCLRVLPFTKNIAPYMAVADVVMGKAGPNFIAEAVMLEKPFLATAFIPGQEAPNLAFLERHNLGWVCLEPAAQHYLIARLASDPAVVAERVDSVRAYRAWNMQANRDIYAVIAEQRSGGRYSQRASPSPSERSTLPGVPASTYPGTPPRSIADPPPPADRSTPGSPPG
jgi:UDP-N-acetylglucosamine:LPS N-acetylglucosamine transferase